ncbi:MAG: hypothetical protein ABFE07_28160 [Armatimonadia bacterium]
MSLDRRVSKLPRWAQQLIGGLQLEINHLQGLKKAHALLAEADRHWFVIRNDNNWPTEHVRLWVLHPNDPQSICDLGPGDLLLVARARRGDPK